MTNAGNQRSHDIYRLFMNLVGATLISAMLMWNPIPSDSMLGGYKAVFGHMGMSAVYKYLLCVITIWTTLSIITNVSRDTGKLRILGRYGMRFLWACLAAMGMVFIISWMANAIPDAMMLPFRVIVLGMTIAYGALLFVMLLSLKLEMYDLTPKAMGNFLDKYVFFVFDLKFRGRR